MPIKLSTHGLCKRYGTATALEPTDIDVHKGEFLTLLGPSGSGKTTLLQMIAGLVEPTGGQILFDGKDGTSLAPGRRGVGMVFQSYALFPHMSVGDNVAYPLRMRNVATREIRSKVDRALNMVQMLPFAERLPRELSGGQQQRVALARCFVYSPDIILLDEPLGALDKNLREHMQMEIRRLHRELGATFIYVTHDQEEALTLSDRICLMNQAKVEQIGTPVEMYEFPASRFAASFIGHSNLMEGIVKPGTGSQPACFAWGDTDLPLPAAAALSGEATLMVRPENLRLTALGCGLLRGRISQVVFQGADLKVLVDVPGNSRAVTVRAQCHGERVAVNDLVGLSWDPSRSVLLSN